MKSTENYGLYLEDDSSTKFQDWRERMNGVNDSNMMKIDAALGEKANASFIIQTTIRADNWSGESAPYSQTISVEGLLATHNGTAAVSNSALNEAYEAAAKADIRIIGQVDNAIAVLAYGDVPAIDIPIDVTIIG